MGSKVFAWLTLIAIGGIIGDIIAHPEGTKQAADAVGRNFFIPSLNTTLGYQTK